MKRRHQISVLTRAAIIVGSIMAVVTGVTFAALQSQHAVVKGNVIQTAIANLQLSSDGTNYTNTMNGYAFSSLVPGGPASPTNGYPVYIKNNGTTPLTPKLSIPKPITNPDNVDLSKVRLILTPFGGGAVQNIPLQDLVTSASGGGVALTYTNRIIPNQVIGFSLQILMESDAFSGASASLNDIDFSFGATASN